MSVNIKIWTTGTRIRPVVTGRKNAREPFTKGFSWNFCKNRATIKIIISDGKASKTEVRIAPGIP